MYIGMLWPLLLAALGYTLAFAAIVIARTRAAVMERRIRALLMARRRSSSRMTHLPFIAASYALGVLLPAAFAVAAFLRMRTAQRRLAAIDPRASPGTPARARPGTP